MSPTTLSELSEAGVRLIQEFESFESKAYPDPRHGWDVPTIGYGTTVYSTGEKVRRGDTITKAEAERELHNWLETKIAPKLKLIPHFEEMHDLMKGALESFAYNLGANFFGSSGFSTISQKLRDKDWKNMRQAFILYRNPGTNVEAGLLRRRNAEAAMWEDGLAALEASGAAKDIAPDSQRWDTERLTKLILSFRPENPNHVKSLEELSALLPATAFSDEAKWVKAFRQPIAAPSRDEKTAGFSLPVQYFSQRDSQTGHAHRMCFSSCCAMLLDYLKPGVIHGPNGDDEYLARVLRFGDTIEASAQVAALKSYGLQASFQQKLNWKDVDAQLNKGIPVPLGILHHGHVSRPSGDGHWIVIIGRTAEKDAYWVHDPYGDLDLINGGHTNVSGKKLRYSMKNLGPRWMVEGDKTGWGIIAQK